MTGTTNCGKNNSVLLQFPQNDVTSPQQVQQVGLLKTGGGSHCCPVLHLLVL